MTSPNVPASPARLPRVALPLTFEQVEALSYLFDVVVIAYDVEHEPTRTALLAVQDRVFDALDQYRALSESLLVLPRDDA